eukprot:7195441-Pyramimonas_sp.AAC.1
MGLLHVQAAVLVASVFLFRVQSETMGLEVGMKRDARALPPGRNCTCARVPSHCCAARAVAPLLRGKSAGVKVFDLASSSFFKD